MLNARLWPSREKSVVCCVSRDERTRASESMCEVSLSAGVGPADAGIDDNLLCAGVVRDTPEQREHRAML